MSPVPAPPTRVFVVVAEKGGVGKTTTAINLAAALVEAGHRCLIIDVDAQRGGATSALGVHDVSPERTILPVLLEQASLESIIRPTSSGIDLAPSCFSLAGLAFMAEVAREVRLRSALSQFIGAGCPYAYIFIDCPPRLDVFSVGALVAADVALIPFVPEPLDEFTLEDVFRTLQSVRLLRAGASPLQVLGFIPNRVDPRRQSLTRAVMGRLPPNIPVLTTIHDSGYVSRQFAQGRTIFQIAPRSRAADEYRQLGQEVARVN